MCLGMIMVSRKRHLLNSQWNIVSVKWYCQYLEGFDFCLISSHVTSLKPLSPTVNPTFYYTVIFRLQHLIIEIRYSSILVHVWLLKAMLCSERHCYLTDTAEKGCAEIALVSVTANQNVAASQSEILFFRVAFELSVIFMLTGQHTNGKLCQCLNNYGHCFIFVMKHWNESAALLTTPITTVSKPLFACFSYSRWALERRGVSCETASS